MSDELRLISCPFHNGLRAVSMGRGATRLCGDEPLRAGIEAAGWTVSSEEIDAVQETAPEIARVSELIRRLATRVLGAVDAGSFPLVFAGNCNSSLGTVAAADGPPYGGRFPATTRLTNATSC